MKKYISLLSILALAGCMGGGSGGVNGGGAPTPITDRVAASNSVVTNMVSNSKTQVAIYVANKLGDDAASVGLGNTGRGATTRGAFVPSVSGNSGLDYDKAQELIELAIWLGNDSTTNDDIVAMFNDSTDGKTKIKSALKLLDGMYCFVGGSAEETANRIVAQRSASAFVAPLAELQKHSEIITLDGVDLYTYNGDRVKFNVDADGKIISYEYPDYLTHNDDGTVSFKYYDDNGERIYPNDDDEDGLMVRQGDTNKFIQEAVWPLANMVDDDPDLNIIYEGTVTNQNGTLTLKIYDEYISYAKSLGLKYSDFGVLRTDVTKATFETDGLDDVAKQEVREFLDSWGVFIEPFAGGYATKKISDDDMMTLANNGDVTFTGTAVADVRYRDGYAYNGNGIDVPLTNNNMTDNNATLVFDQSGTQTLTADFSDNWYAMQIVKSSDGTNQLIIDGDRNHDGDIDANDRVTKTVVYNGEVLDPFDDNSKVAVYDPIEDKTTVTYDFTMETSEPGLTGDMYPIFNGSSSPDTARLASVTGYYGDDGAPGEAVATAHYDLEKASNWTWSQDGNGQWVPDSHGGEGNISIEFGFGGVVQQPAN